MSVTIKGMDMPKNCYECPLGAFYHVRQWRLAGSYKLHDLKCGLTKKTLTSTKRNRFCPLEEQESE